MPRVYLYGEHKELGGIDVIEYLAEHLTPKQIEKKIIPKYYKPKVRYERTGQFPWRCPICRDKFLFKAKAEQCLEECWEKVPAQVWTRIEELNKKEQETGSWQWDLDGDHRKYCGVVYYNTGEIRYAVNRTGERGQLEFVSQKELIRILETADVKYLWSASGNPLPKPLQKFADVPKRVRPENKDRIGLLVNQWKPKRR